MAVGKNLFNGELQRLILLHHEGIAVDDVKGFRRGQIGAGACVFVHKFAAFRFFRAHDNLDSRKNS